jgi:hypothetical protein
MAFLVSGCTEVGSPAVHDMPAPRIDTTLTPDQVKRATDDLATQRDHLESNAAANGQPAPPVPVVASGPAPPPQNASLQPATGPAITGATQTAGVGSKP